MAKVDFSKYIVDPVVALAAVKGNEWAVKRMEQWDEPRLEFAKQYLVTDPLVRAYKQGKIKRPAHKPPGNTGSGNRTRWAMFYAREAKRQLEAQGVVWRINKVAAKAAMDHLRLRSWSKADGVSETTLTDNLRRNR